MAKRFTDTDKWKKKFIRGLEGPYKLLWFYILDECDHAGIWIVDFEVARIRLGEEVNEQDASVFFAEKILKIDDGGKWFVLDFIDFQYGVLNEANRAHKSVINILKRYEIWCDEENTIKENKPLISPLQGAKDMDKDKDKDKDKEKGGKKSKFTPPTLEEVLEYFSGNGYSLDTGKKAFNYYQSGSWKDSTGKPVKNWKQKMQGVWFKPENKEKKESKITSNPYEYYGIKQ